MTFRPLFAALALVSLAAPLAAHADAPLEHINTIFAVDQAIKVDRPQFDRSQARLSVDGEQPATAAVNDDRTREQVRRELASMPQEKVGS